MLLEAAVLSIRCIAGAAPAKRAGRVARAPAERIVANLMSSADVGLVGDFWGRSAESLSVGQMHEILSIEETKMFAVSTRI